MSNELSVANTFLSTLLKADPLLAAQVGTRIYADNAPEASPSDTIYPLVLFNFMAASDVRTTGGRRIYTNPLYQVRAEGTGGYGSISAACDRIDATLDGQRSVAVSVGGITYYVDCYRERPIQLPVEVSPGGIKYYARGGLYRLYIGLPS